MSTCGLCRQYKRETGFELGSCGVTTIQCGMSFARSEYLRIRKRFAGKVPLYHELTFNQCKRLREYYIRRSDREFSRAKVI